MLLKLACSRKFKKKMKNKPEIIIGFTSPMRLLWAKFISAAFENVCFLNVFVSLKEMHQHQHQHKWTEYDRIDISACKRSFVIYKQVVPSSASRFRLKMTAEKECTKWIFKWKHSQLEDFNNIFRFWNVSSHKHEAIFVIAHLYSLLWACDE